MLSFENLKNKHLAKECIICGNGPSLVPWFVEQIRKTQMFCFVSNGFCFMFDKVDFIPDVVCMSNYDAIRKFGNKYPSSTKKFFKAGWRNYVELKDNIENVYELPFACNHDRGEHKEKFIKDGNFTLDPSKQNYCGDTVLLDFAIPLAFYMGFYKIYLCGVDCDYSKGYFSNDYKVSTLDSFTGMVNGDYSIAIPSYKYVKEFLNMRGCVLYRLTDSDRLDFIEKRTLEQTIGKKNRL